jgi:hypothetical protein
MKCNDIRDIDPYELKLIRVGHALWLLFRKARKSEPLSEIKALEEALKTVWELKRQYRQDLAEKRIERNRAVRERFQALKRKQAA